MKKYAFLAGFSLFALNIITLDAWADPDGVSSVTQNAGAKANLASLQATMPYQTQETLFARYDAGALFFFGQDFLDATQQGTAITTTTAPSGINTADTSKNGKLATVNNVPSGINVVDSKPDSASSDGNSTVIKTRQDFTTYLSDSLQSGSGNLVIADQNPQDADLQALPTHDQLGIVALGVSGQQSQTVLRLLP